MPYRTLSLESLALRVFLQHLPDPWAAAEQVLQREVLWGNLPPNLAAGMVALAGLSSNLCFRVASRSGKMKGIRADGSLVEKEQLIGMMEAVGFLPVAFRELPDRGELVVFGQDPDENPDLYWRLAARGEEVNCYCEFGLDSCEYDDEDGLGFWDSFAEGGRLVGRDMVRRDAEGTEFPKMIEVVNMVGMDEEGDLQG